MADTPRLAGNHHGRHGFDAHGRVGLDGGAHLLGNLDSLLECSTRQQHAELLTAVATDAGIVSELGVQQLGNHLQNLVADSVAMLVVDLF